MVKKARITYALRFGEVSPKLVKYTRRKSSSSPKLETIVEEGCDKISHEDNFLMSKRALFLLPVFVSFVSYFLLYRYVSNFM